MLRFIWWLIPALAQGQTVIPAIQGMDVVSGKPYTLAICSGCSSMVVAFTSNECPYDAYYRDRMTQLERQFDGKTGFVWVNAYTEPEESATAMKSRPPSTRAPYLADKDQKVMEALGARKSPEVFVLVPVSGGWKILYQGAIDDNPQVVNDVHEHFLEAAIEAAASHRLPEVTEERAVGCTIRRK